jgi:hypothetical protein
MCTSKTKFLSAATLLLGMVTSAGAATISVTPWIAPNVFGSTSYTAAEANAVQGLYQGASSFGPAGPTQFNAQSNATSSQVIVTNFNSWMGQAAPGIPYQNEYGNRLHFGLVINGNGEQFSISQLSFVAVSTDPFNGLGFSFAQGSYNYGAGYQGILKGQDGLLFTNDDTFVTAGANTTLVDGLVGRGSGNAFEALCTGCTLAQQQAAISAIASYPGSDYTFTGTYTLGADTGDNTFHISGVPETSTWVMMILGFAGMGVMAQRRARKFKMELAAA